MKALIDLHTFNALNKMQDDLEHGHGHGHKHHDLGLDEEQANLMISAIEMHEIKAEDIMTNINKVYSLSYDTTLDSNTIRTIVSKGFSRIPIYTAKDCFIGILKINSLLKVNPDLKKSIKNLGIGLFQPVVLPPEATVYEAFQALRKGKSQMAFISNNVEGLKLKLIASSPRETIVGNSVVEKLMEKDSRDIKNVEITTEARDLALVENTSNSNANSYNAFESKLKTVAFSKNNVTDSYFDNRNQSDILGVVTLEDVIERMIKIDIFDEEDYITKKARASLYHGRSQSRFSIKEQKISKLNQILILTNLIDFLVSKEISRSLIRDESFRLNSLLDNRRQSMHRLSNVS